MVLDIKYFILIISIITLLFSSYSLISTESDRLQQLFSTAEIGNLQLLQQLDKESIIPLDSKSEDGSTPLI